MTTIAANRYEIAADSLTAWDEVNDDTFTSQKLYAARNRIYGLSGENCTGALTAIGWLCGDCSPENKPHPPEYEHEWDWKILELSPYGLAVYNEYLERDPVLANYVAIGSGAKVALYCMAYLGMSPPEAVREACKVDSHSSPPIYVARLSDCVIERWKPKRSKK